jgi:hypothetical protein
MYYPIIFIAVAIILSGSNLSAQVIVEEKISTDTVDVFKKEEARIKNAPSAKWASFATILLPGAGHQIVGDYKKAMFYFATEAVLIGGIIFCERSSSRLYGDSRNFAWQHAGTESEKDPDDEYWKNIGDKNYRSSNEYNYTMNLNRQFEKKYLRADEYWAWEDDSYQTTYRDIRSNASRFQIIGSFLVGAMILDRIVSFIDVRVTSKRKNPDEESTGLGLNIQPHYSFSSRQAGLTLCKQF